MAKDPCCMCGERFVGAAVTGYHRWYLGDVGKGYKQKLCPKCAKIHFEPTKCGMIDNEGIDSNWPTACPTCKIELDDAADQSYSTWYRGQARRDVTYVHCPHCAASLRTIMMVGADVLADREPAGVGGGGAPAPNPPGFGRKDDLPW